MTGNTNPRVTMRLTETEVRHYIRNHSHQFTCAAARRIVAELTSGYGKRSRCECHAHGASCVIVYDAGEHFFYVTTSAYPDREDAWADTRAHLALASDL
jgi:hypothetical protein